VNKVENYLSLREKNKQLKQENIQLKNYIEQYLTTEIDSLEILEDTVYDQQFEYIGARVINNSTNKQHNYITLDRGSESGIEPDMGVVSMNGVVGVVRGVSDHFSTVISLLNNELRISSKHDKSGYFGSLSWDGRDYHYARLGEIPLHTDLSKGDTIVTSGYSTIFPEGILVGFVDSWEEKGGSFYEIKVRLSTDFKKISEVYVIKNIYKEEQEKLEEESMSND
jgi:rod shape-determining protein MreC